MHIIASLTLIFLILLHSGRGGGLSDMFGGGSLGGSMAGSTAVERNLDRITVITAMIFIFTSVLLAPATQLTSRSFSRSSARALRAVFSSERAELPPRPSTNGVASAVRIGGEAGGPRCRRKP